MGCSHGATIRQEYADAIFGRSGIRACTSHHEIVVAAASVSDGGGRECVWGVVWT
jgi:hypothetical protein